MKKYLLLPALLIGSASFAVRDADIAEQSSEGSGADSLFAEIIIEYTRKVDGVLQSGIFENSAQGYTTARTEEGREWNKKRHRDSYNYGEALVKQMIYSGELELIEAGWVLADKLYEAADTAADSARMLSPIEKDNLFHAVRDSFRKRHVEVLTRTINSQRLAIHSVFSENSQLAEGIKGAFRNELLKHAKVIRRLYAGMAWDMTGKAEMKVEFENMMKGYCEELPITGDDAQFCKMPVQHRVMSRIRDSDYFEVMPRIRDADMNGPHYVRKTYSGNSRIRELD
jgi:hypothetical protein